MYKKLRVIVGAVLLGGLMVGLYVGCPTLFTVDLAKAPYVEANNLELTRVYSRAIPKYQKIIEEYPNSEYVPHSEIGIANCYRKLGKTDKAIELYNKFIEKYKDDSNNQRLVRRAFLYIAGTYRDRGRVDDAMEAYENLIDDYPGTESAEDALTALETLKQQAGRGRDRGQVVTEYAGPKLIELTTFDVPQGMEVGEKKTINIELTNVSEKVLYNVTIQTDIRYWEGMKVESLQPNPISIQEFWGFRRWTYKELQPQESLAIEAVITAKESGTFESVLKVEANMSDTGMTSTFSTTVK